MAEQIIAIIRRNYTLAQQRRSFHGGKYESDNILLGWMIAR